MILPYNIKKEIEDFVLEHENKEYLDAYNLKPKNKLLFLGSKGVGKMFVVKELASRLNRQIREPSQIKKEDKNIIVITNEGAITYVTELTVYGIVIVIVEKLNYKIPNPYDFDAVIRFPLPDLPCRIEFFKEILQNNFDFEVLAKEADGMTYDDIDIICKNALKKSIIKNIKMTIYDVKDAIAQRQQFWRNIL